MKWEVVKSNCNWSTICQHHIKREKEKQVIITKEIKVKGIMVIKYGSGQNAKHTKGVLIPLIKLNYFYLFLLECSSPTLISNNQLIIHNHQSGTLKVKDSKRRRNNLALRGL